MKVFMKNTFWRACQLFLRRLNQIGIVWRISIGLVALLDELWPWMIRKSRYFSKVVYLNCWGELPKLGRVPWLGKMAAFNTFVKSRNQSPSQRSPSILDADFPPKRKRVLGTNSSLWNFDSMIAAIAEISSSTNDVDTDKRTGIRFFKHGAPPWSGSGGSLHRCKALECDIINTQPDVGSIRKNKTLEDCLVRMSVQRNSGFSCWSGVVTGRGTISKSIW